MKKLLEIENCRIDCKYHWFDYMSPKLKHYCYHPIFRDDKEQKRILINKLTKKHPFPEWCPLDDKVEEPKYTFTLNCERCGVAYDSDFAFPPNQLCPSCNKLHLYNVVSNSFCDLYKKKCMGRVCSITPYPEKCEHLNQAVL